ncbi:TLC domain-containing protein 2 [Exaiptasia diaphana]|uniref:TLC domain-containing protein n=1 Tax=Exaiptasia diaphana TaxID=2652724 RepID=A0A913Y458_EXADI|nr:TLC domain-containing protein 2 [Exaiptasia diaphana]KXJ28926.1 TLC domain-containing protein 2 [Exaiptasia diaphana]
MTMELPSIQSALGTVVASFVSIRIFSAVLKVNVHYPISIRVGPPRKKWLYRNIWISLIHSTLTAVLSVYSFFNEPDMLTDMVQKWSTFAYYLVCVSLGYFFHDILDLICNDMKNSGGLLIHHVVVIGAFSLAVFHQAYLGFAMCSLLIEVNSVFLHARRLMSFHNVSKTSLKYEINGLLMLFSFIAFRFLTSGWMVNFVIQNRHVLPRAVTIYGCIAMGILIIVNIILFLTIWNADFKKRIQKKDQN